MREQIRRPSRRGVVVIALTAMTIVTLAAIVFLGRNDGDHPVMQTDRGRLVIRSGTARATDLATFAPAAVLHGKVLTLRRAVRVEPGATLDLEHLDIHLAAGSHPASIDIDGGRLSLSDSTVRSFVGSFQPDALGASGDRAEILIRGGATAMLSRSNIVGLGRDAAHPGLMVTGRTSTATISGGTLHDNVAGVTVRLGAALTLEHTRVQGNTSSGIVAHGARFLDVRNAAIDGNTGNGLAITSTPDVRLFDLEVTQNGDDGINLTAGQRTSIKHTVIWGNTDGIDVRDDTAVSVESTTVSANRASGIRLDGPTARLHVKASRLDHNGSGGVTMLDGTLRLVDTRVVDNFVGLLVVDELPRIVAVGNTVARSHTDAFVFVGRPDTTVSHNRIVDNRGAAFAVAATGAAGFLSAQNELAHNGAGAERVMGES